MPAGGLATRVSPLPCSKEIYPVGFHIADNKDSLRPKVVCHYMLEKMRSAHVNKVFIILRKGKWDIPEYLGSGGFLDMHLSYLLLDLPYGVPYTLDQAYPFVKNSTIAFGFPDIIFHPGDAFVQLTTKLVESNAEIVLGLFPASRPEYVDMVELGDDGSVHGIHIKPPHTHLRYTWIIAVWTPVFTRFMHKYVMAHAKDVLLKETENKNINQHELYVGNVIQVAIKSAIQVETVIFEDGEYIDVGTSDGLIKSVRIHTEGLEKLK